MTSLRADGWNALGGIKPHWTPAPASEVTFPAVHASALPSHRVVSPPPRGRQLATGRAAYPTQASHRVASPVRLTTAPNASGGYYTPQPGISPVQVRVPATNVQTWGGHSSGISRSASPARFISRSVSPVRVSSPVRVYTYRSPSPSRGVSRASPPVSRGSSMIHDPVIHTVRELASGVLARLASDAQLESVQELAGLEGQPLWTLGQMPRVAPRAPPASSVEEAPREMPASSSRGALVTESTPGGKEEARSLSGQSPPDASPGSAASDASTGNEDDSDEEIQMASPASLHPGGATPLQLPRLAGDDGSPPWNQSLSTQASQMSALPRSSNPFGQPSSNLPALSPCLAEGQRSPSVPAASPVERMASQGVPQASSEVGMSFVSTPVAMPTAPSTLVDGQGTPVMFVPPPNGTMSPQAPQSLPAGDVQMAGTPLSQSLRTLPPSGGTSADPFGIMAANIAMPSSSRVADAQHTSLPSSAPPGSERTFQATPQHFSPYHGGISPGSNGMVEVVSSRDSSRTLPPFQAQSIQSPTSQRMSDPSGALPTSRIFVRGESLPDGQHTPVISPSLPFAGPSQGSQIVTSQEMPQACQSGNGQMGSPVALSMRSGTPVNGSASIAMPLSLPPASSSLGVQRMKSQVLPQASSQVGPSHVGTPAAGPSYVGTPGGVSHVGTPVGPSYVGTPAGPSHVGTPVALSTSSGIPVDLQGTAIASLPLSHPATAMMSSQMQSPRTGNGSPTPVAATSVKSVQQETPQVFASADFARMTTADIEKLFGRDSQPQMPLASIPTSSSEASRPSMPRSDHASMHSAAPAAQHVEPPAATDETPGVEVPCPPGFDAATWNELPLEMRQELAAPWIESLRRPPPGVDPSVWETMPLDIRHEMLQEQRPQRPKAKAKASSTWATAKAKTRAGRSSLFGW